VTQSYRVRFSTKLAGQRLTRDDVQTVDVQCDLEHIPGQLPPAAYILSIEDLITLATIHWTRWPKSYRPS
jgi:hypothetical protein